MEKAFLCCGCVCCAMTVVISYTGNAEPLRGFPAEQAAAASAGTGTGCGLDLLPSFSKGPGTASSCGFGRVSSGSLPGEGTVHPPASVSCCLCALLHLQARSTSVLLFQGEKIWDCACSSLI